MGAGQYSKASRRRLEAATAELVEQLQRYTGSVGSLRRRRREVAELFESNEQLHRAVEDWNERAFDHTGTFPLALRLDDEDDDDAAPEAGEGRVSVVSRFDLDVFDAAALLAAGRASYRRAYPKERKDAALHVHGVGIALATLADDAGEPWYDMPGVQLLGGARVYLLPDPPVQSMPDDPDNIRDMVVTPPGRTDFSETWA